MENRFDLNIHDSNEVSFEPTTFRSQSKYSGPILTNQIYYFT